MALLAQFWPESGVDETNIDLRRWYRALTTVPVLPVGSEVLSVVPHGKTRVCYTGRLFPFDMILIKTISGPLGFESTLK